MTFLLQTSNLSFSLSMERIKNKNMCIYLEVSKRNSSSQKMEKFMLELSHPDIPLFHSAHQGPNGLTIAALSTKRRKKRHLPCLKELQTRGQLSAKTNPSVIFMS